MHLEMIQEYKQIEVINFDNKASIDKYELFQGNILPSIMFIVDDKRLIESTLQRLREENDSQGLQSLIKYPFVSNMEEAKPFLQTKRVFFKIFADLKNTKQLIQNQNWSEYYKDKIEEIHVYNNQEKSIYIQFHELKSSNPKIKQLHNNLDPFFDYFQKRKDYHARFIKPIGKLQQYAKNKALWPSFLSADDLSENITYRACLLTNRKIVEQHSSKTSQNSRQIEEMMKNYKGFIKRLKQSNPLEPENKVKWEVLEQYQKIERNKQGYLGSSDTIARLLACYKCNSFYSNVMNIMLRISRKPEDFRYIALPVAETHLMIRENYKKFIRNSGNKRPAYKLYRGTRLDSNDTMKEGQIYQILGFVSTSTEQDQAETFASTHTDSWIIQIQIPERIIAEEDLDDDPGFFDFHQFQQIEQFRKLMGEIQKKDFLQEKQVLINNGAILKLIKIIKQDKNNLESNDKPNKDYPKLRFKYMTIFELEQQYMNQKQNLDDKEEQPNDSFLKLEKMVMSYRLFKQQQRAIQDRGDLYRYLQDYEAELRYYTQKVNNQETNNQRADPIISLKLMDAQLRCGSVTKTAVAIKKFIEQNHQQIFEVKSIRNKVIKILKQLEENQALGQLQERIIAQLQKDKQNNYFEIVEALYEQGQIQISQEKLSEGVALFNQCNRILNNKILELSQRIQNIGSAETNCCYSFAVNFGFVQPVRHLSIQEKQQKKNDFSQQIVKNIKLNLKVLKHLIQCEVRMKIHKKSSDSNQIQSLVDKANEFFVQWDKIQHNKQLSSGLKSFKQELKSFRVNQPITLQNCSKYVEQYNRVMQGKILAVQDQISKEEQINPISQKLAQLYETRSTLQEEHLGSTNRLPNPAFCQESTNISDIELILPKQKSKNSRTIIDQQKIQQTTASIASGYQKSIEISSFNKGPDSIEVLNKRILLSQHYSKLGLLQKSTEQVSNITKTQRQSIIMPKAYLLLGKNFLFKGQLKQANNRLKQAKQLLHTIKIKQNNEESFWNMILLKTKKYKDLYSTPLYYEIELLKLSIDKKIVGLKINNQQDSQKGSPSQKENQDSISIEVVFQKLEHLKQKVTQNMYESLRNQYLAKIQEEMGTIVALYGNLNIRKGCLFTTETSLFTHYFLKSIQYLNFRGQSNIQIAHNYCHMATFLIDQIQNMNRIKGIETAPKIKSLDIKGMKEVLELAKTLVGKAMKIFSYFPVNHPQIWAPFLALHNVKRVELDLKIQEKSLMKKKQNNLNQTIMSLNVDSSKNQAQYEIIINSLKYCKELVQKTYKDKSHITYIKINYKYYEFKSNLQLEQAQQNLKNLREVLDKNDRIKLINDPFPKQQKYLTPDERELMAEDQKVEIKMKIIEILSRIQSKTNDTQKKSVGLRLWNTKLAPI